MDIISDGLTTQASSPNGLITDTCFSLVNQRCYLVDYTDNNSYVMDKLTNNHSLLGLWDKITSDLVKIKQGT